MQIGALAVILGAFAGDGELVLLLHHLDVFGAKAGDCQRDAIAVLAILQDVEGRIAIVFTRACFEQVEQAIATYRSDARRVGKESVSKCRYRWYLYDYINKKRNDTHT